MKRAMSIMTREEKTTYIRIPLLMLGLFLGFAIMGLLAILADQRELAYTLWGAGAFLFIFFFTEWWSSLRAWRNGETLRTGTKEADEN